MSERSTSAKYFILALALLAIVAGICVTVLHRRAPPSAGAHRPMTPAENNYINEIEATNVEMSEASNFLGDTVYYLDGSLVNKGSRTVREVDLAMNFMDPFGEAVLYKTTHPVTPQVAPLKPGETRPLHLAFEKLPDTWNQGPPVITVSYVSF